MCNSDLMFHYELEFSSSNRSHRIVNGNSPLPDTNRIATDCCGYCNVIFLRAGRAPPWLLGSKVPSEGLKACGFLIAQLNGLLRGLNYGLYSHLKEGHSRSSWNPSTRSR